MRLPAYIAACAIGAVLGLLGEEPLIGVLIGVVVVFPIATGVIIGADSSSRGPRTPALLPALAAGLTGTAIVVFLIRLAIAAPDWVDPLVADCGGATVSTQQAAVWFASLIFVLATLPEVVTVAAIGRRLRTMQGPSFPVSLSFFPIAVAFSGLALIIVSFATTC